MRKSLTLEILEHLAVCGIPIVLSSLSVPYGQGLRQSIRKTEEKILRCRHDFSLRSAKTISATLSRLKRKGLVAISGSKKKAVWNITVIGKRHFAARKGWLLPAEDGKIRLVMFDIPEGEKSKRDWLRLQLIACDYGHLQRSVWIGTRPLPEELLQELKKRGLNSYVHIVGLEEAVRLRG